MLLVTPRRQGLMMMRIMMMRMGEMPCPDVATTISGLRPLGGNIFLKPMQLWLIINL